MVWWWYIYFYGSYTINWTFNPFMMGYEESGHFTFKGKSYYSFYYNFPWYLLYIGMFAVFMGVLYLTEWGRGIISSGGGALAVLIGLNLTISLLWLAIVIGYGMIRIPIACWKNSDYEHMVNYYRYKVA